MDMPKHLAEALVDGQTYADFEKLHAVFTELRTTAPVALAKPDGIEPFGSYPNSMICSLLKRTTACSMPATNPHDYGRRIENRYGGDRRPNRFITLVQMDGEKHAAYRELPKAGLAPVPCASLNRAYVNARKMLSPACWPKAMLRFRQISRFIIRCA